MVTVHGNNRAVPFYFVVDEFEIFWYNNSEYALLGF